MQSYFTQYDKKKLKKAIQGSEETGLRGVSQW
jgi:hypothetical protein